MAWLPVFTDWREMLNEELDAVMILTSGSHAPIAIAAAEAGLHVFVEKPMCFSVDEGQAMVDATAKAGVKLMVGYPKRYDPAFARFRDEFGALAHPKLLRVTTCESPFHPYVTPLSTQPARRRRPRRSRGASRRHAVRASPPRSAPMIRST